MSDEARAVLDTARILPPEEQILVAEALYDGADGEPAMSRLRGPRRRAVLSRTRTV